MISKEKLEAEKAFKDAQVNLKNAWIAYAKLGDEDKGADAAWGDYNKQRRVLNKARDVLDSTP